MKHSIRTNIVLSATLILLILTSVAHAGNYHIILESGADSVAGNEISIVTYNSFDNLLNDTTSASEFSQINIAPSFNVAGVIFDGKYRVILESGTDSAAGNEIFIVTYNSFDNLLNATTSASEFSQINVASAFNVVGVAYEEMESILTYLPAIISGAIKNKQ